MRPPTHKHTLPRRYTQLVKLLGKISPGLARKIAEKGAKKCGMDYKTAGYVGKAVEKGVQKKQSEDLAAKTAAEGGAVPPTAPPKA